MIQDSSNPVVRKAGKLKAYAEIKFDTLFKQVILLYKTHLQNSLYFQAFKALIIYTSEDNFSLRTHCYTSVSIFVSPKLLFSPLHTLACLIS